MGDFEGVHQAMDAKFSGQASDQPEQTTQESAPEGKDQSQENTPELKAQAVLDLSKAEKFMLDGKEYTYDKLRKEMLLQADYTRKTQEIATERQYMAQQKELNEHFKADLPKVLQNPELLAEMKRHYPEEFVKMAESFLELSPRQQQQAMGQQGMSVDPQSIRKLVEPLVKPIQDKLDKYETEALTKQLDTIVTQMKTKFPSADEEYAIARLRALSDQNVPITEQKIEEVFKYFHEKDIESKETYHREKLKKQSEANKKGSDIAAGGGTPGQAPTKLKLNEVAGALTDHLRRSYT
jgi:hypothetical protein